MICTSNFYQLLSFNILSLFKRKINKYRRNLFGSLCHKINIFIFYKLYKITMLINITATILLPTFFIKIIKTIYIYSILRFPSKYLIKLIV